MTWADDVSVRSARQLDTAWNSLNVAFTMSRISLRVQHRITACVRDTVTCASILKEFHDELVADFEAKAARRYTQTDAEHVQDWSRTAKTSMRKVHRYAAVMRAMFFFVRALQDALYAGLVELRGGRTADHISMAKCAGNPAAYLHQRIEDSCPGYFAWFSEQRSLRNHMKLGAAVDARYDASQPTRCLTIGIRRVRDNPPSSVADRRVAYQDVESALEYSSRLVALVTELVLLHE